MSAATLIACVVLPFALGLTYGIAQDRRTRRRQRSCPRCLRPR